MALPVNPGIQIVTVWDYSRSAYTLQCDWSALYPEFDENISFRVQVFDGETLLGDVSTVNNKQSIYGIPDQTTMRVELIAFHGTDMRYLETSVSTPRGLPGKLVNYNILQLEDQIRVEWDNVPFADAYLCRIYLGEVLLETIDSAVPLVSFGSLPHSRLFTIEIQPYNSLDQGDITSFQTHTTYLVPPAPFNLRQHEERIIAVILQWEIQSPEIITEVQIQAWDGDEMFLEDTMNSWQRERSIPCPSTGSTYLFKLRAGNPAGWSEWVEFEGYTEVFPRIDSRLAALGAAYQEDLLRVDTWNHSYAGKDALDDRIRTGADIEIAPTGYVYADAGLVPVSNWASDQIVFSQPKHEFNAWTRWMQHKYWHEEQGRFNQKHEIRWELEYFEPPDQPKYVYYWASEIAPFNQTHNVTLASYMVQYQMNFTDTAPLVQTHKLTLTLEHIQ